MRSWGWSEPMRWWRTLIIIDKIKSTPVECDEKNLRSWSAQVSSKEELACIRKCKGLN